MEELEKIGVELARVLEGGPKEKGKKEKKGKKKVKEEEEEGEEGESATLKKDKKDKKDMKRDKKDKKDMKRGKKDDVVTEGESPTLNDKKDKKIKKKGKKERKEAKEKPNSEDSKPPAAQKEAPDLTKRTTTPAVATTTYRGGPIHTSKPMGPVHTDWAAAQLQGGDARKAKFLRLLGAKPQPTTSTLDSTKPKTTSGVDLSVIRKREKDLEHQFNTGLMMKTEPGSKRRGLGA